MKTRISPTVVCVIICLLIACLKFLPYILTGKVPLPFDLTVGAYLPWRDYDWGYPTGVPIKNPLLSDVTSQLYPWLILAKQQITSGHLPLWNPYAFLGYPYLANYHSSLLFPTNLLLLLGDTAVMRTFQLFIHQCLGLIIMFFYLQQKGRSSSASLIGALTFTSGGLMMTDFEFASGSKALIWLPACLLAIDKYLTTYRGRYLLLLSISYTLLILAGHFQVLVFASLIILFKLVTTTYQYPRKSHLFIICLSLATSILLSAPQLLLSYELMAQSIRIDEQYLPTYNYGILPIKHLITTFIAPDYFGNHTTDNYFGFWNYRETIGYIGIGTTWLILTGLLQYQWSRWHFATLLSLCFIFIPALAILPYTLNIPLISTGAASRLLFIHGFFVAVLAAQSWDIFWNNSKKFQILSLASPWLVVLILAVYTATHYFSTNVTIQSQAYISLRNLIFPLGILGIITAAITLYIIIHRHPIKQLIPFVIILFFTLDFLRFHYKWNTYTDRALEYPTTPSIEFLANSNSRFAHATEEILPPNNWLAYPLNSLSGYDPLHPLKNNLYLQALNNHTYPATHVSRYLDKTNNFNSPLLDLSGTNYLVAKQQQLVINPHNLLINDSQILHGFQIVFQEGDTIILQNKQAVPLVYANSQVKQLSNENQLMHTLFTAKIPYTTFTDDSLSQQYPTNNQSIQPIQFIMHNDGTLKGQITANSNTIVTFNQAKYPGWKATLNNQTVPIKSINYLFMGIEVPPGNHVFTFTYDPPLLKLGLILTGVGILALIQLIRLHPTPSHLMNITQRQTKIKR